MALLLVRPDELRVAPRSIPERSVGAVLEHLVAGLVYVRRTPVVLAAIVVIGVVSTAALNLQVTLPLIAADLLAGGPRGLRVPRGRQRRRLARERDRARVRRADDARAHPPRRRRDRPGDVARRVLATRCSLSVVLMFVVGWGLIAMAATTNTIIQVTTPDELRGRVMSVYTTVFAGTIAVRRPWPPG